MPKDHSVLMIIDLHGDQDDMIHKIQLKHAATIKKL